MVSHIPPSAPRMFLIRAVLIGDLWKSPPPFSLRSPKTGERKRRCSAAPTQSWHLRVA